MKTPEEVFVVITEDHHTGIAVEVWADREAAIARARKLAEVAAIFPEDYVEGLIDSCEFWALYSIEGDSVRVVKVPLQQPVEAGK